MECEACAGVAGGVGVGGAIKRAKRWMLQRISCVVLGNVGTADDLTVLEHLQSHAHEVLRKHAAWAVRALRSSTPDVETVE